MKSSRGFPLVTYTAFYSPAPVFTRDPDELRGERIRCELVTPPNGNLGMTIAPMNDEEFCQVDALAENGVAGKEGIQIG